MKNILIITMAITILMGLAFSSTGSFGEYASLNPCKCILLNSTNPSGQWILKSTFNTTIFFYITKPNITGATITTSVMNGTIAPNSTYTIIVSASNIAISNSTRNITTYLIAHVDTNKSNTGATIQLAASKIIRIEPAIQSSSGGGSDFTGGTPGAQGSSSVPSSTRTTTSTILKTTTIGQKPITSTIPATTTAITMATTTIANTMAANSIKPSSHPGLQIGWLIILIIITIIVILAAFQMKNRKGNEETQQGGFEL